MKSIAGQRQRISGSVCDGHVLGHTGNPARHGSQGGGFGTDGGVHNLDGAVQCRLISAPIRQPVHSVSTHYAQLKGPIQAEKKMLKIQVMATKA